MKTVISTLSIALLFVLGSCTGEAALSKDGVMKTLTEQFDGIVTKLEGVKDKAGAEEAKTAIEPMIGKAETAITSLKTLAGGDWQKMLGEKLAPYTGRLTKLAGGLTGKPEVAAILTPLIDKVKGLIPSK